MKTLLTLALTVTLGVSGPAIAANENINEFSNVQAKNKTIVVNLKEGLGKVKLAVYDQKGIKVHQLFVNVKQNTKIPYDLSQLPAGEFTVLIENKSKSSSDKASYTVQTKDEPMEIPLMAYGKALSDNSFQLSVIGLEKPGVNVELLNKDGNIVYKEKVVQEEGFVKVYHLKNMKTSDIHVKVTDVKGRHKKLYF
jgi:peptidyl-tRNA hydrolase